jgi:hypothetical protein
MDAYFFRHNYIKVFFFNSLIVSFTLSLFSAGLVYVHESNPAVLSYITRAPNPANIKGAEFERAAALNLQHEGHHIEATNVAVSFNGLAALDVTLNESVGPILIGETEFDIATEESVYECKAYDHPEKIYKYPSDHVNFHQLTNQLLVLHWFSLLIDELAHREATISYDHVSKRGHSLYFKICSKTIKGGVAFISLSSVDRHMSLLEAKNTFVRTLFALANKPLTVYFQQPITQSFAEFLTRVVGVRVKAMILPAPEACDCGDDSDDDVEVITRMLPEVLCL